MATVVLVKTTAVCPRCRKISRRSILVEAGYAATIRKFCAKCLQTIDEYDLDHIPEAW